MALGSGTSRRQRGLPNYCTYFGASGAVVEKVAPDRYEMSKGGLKFGLSERLPVALVRKLVEARLLELADVRNGLRREYHRDGTVKAVGRVKDGELHGRWNWYRSDGSLPDRQFRTRREDRNLDDLRPLRTRRFVDQLMRSSGRRSRTHTSRTEFSGQWSQRVIEAILHEDSRRWR